MDQQLMSRAEKEAEKAENLRSFSGMKLLHIKNKIAELLSLIGRNEIFDEYTKHDISHINEMLSLVDWLIPHETSTQLTPADWLMVTLSVYFHDLGMLVTKEEFEKREETAFCEYRRSLSDGDLGTQYHTKIQVLGSDKAEKFFFQEYVRKQHPDRIKNWIYQDYSMSVPEIYRNIVNEISSLLNNVDPMFRKDLSLICESHHLDDLDDNEKYKVSRPYGSTPGEVANLHYSAIILRTADLLHMTSDRTPTAQFRIISPSDPISQREWRKQMAVKSVRPQIKKNVEGALDNSLEKDTIEVIAFFDAPNKADSFFALIQYLNYARKELQVSFKACSDAIKYHGSTYQFPWKNIDDSNIETLGFEKRLFEFNLDQARILKLLVGHTLYNDSTVVLRELVQNSIDAIRLQNHIDKLKNPGANIGQVTISWNSNTRNLIFADNGTGMTQDIIENNLLKIGASRYQDDDFKKKYPEFSPISRFGIGILTCFLIADEIDIITCSLEEEKIKKLCIRNVDGKYLLQHVDKTSCSKSIVPHGTEISLQVRIDIDMAELEENLRKWVLFPPCNIFLQIDKHPQKQIGFSSPKESIVKYLNDLGMNVDDKNIKVNENIVDGVTIAYATSYNQHYKEWEFLEQWPQIEKKIQPVGTCIEGIRVEFNTPGYRGKRLLAIANCHGMNAPKTNVARSLVEANTDQEDMLRATYQIFSEHVKKEVDALKRERGFSLTWATQEASHLVSPLVRSRDDHNRDASPLRRDLLVQSLNNIPFALVEKGNLRASYSTVQIKQEPEVWTIDCNLFRSAESLIKESTADTSLNKLLDVLYSDGSRTTYNNDAILCGFNRDSYLYIDAMQNKEVDIIRIYQNDRRIDMRWRNKEGDNKWECFKINRNRYRRYRYEETVLGYNFYIQTQPIEINGFSNEVAVKSFGCTYLLEGSPIHEFILKCMRNLQWREDEDEHDIYHILLEMVDTSFNVFSKNSTDNLEESFEVLINRTFNNNDTNLRVIERVFSVIDKNELKQAIINTKWKIFDTWAWSGRFNSIF